MTYSLLKQTYEDDDIEVETSTSTSLLSQSIPLTKP